ncbi:MAG: response regulator [Syntrophobacterales bacterium]|jgi:response regulator RpfG family c-di-GMP phosphodiesterase|nr:response regulator [Syntrophobacterales bacterium]
MIEGSKVLLVDDSEEVIEILSDFLQMNDCEVRVAYTGRMAIDIFDREEFDIVILDVKLPDTNGLSLLDTIKVKNPTVAVIMITGHHEPDFIVEAMKKGASDFLMKPFECDKLMLSMMRVLRERELLIEKDSILQSIEDKQKIEMLNRELQNKIRELTTMYHISNKFNSLNIFDDVYEKMIHIIGEVMDTKSCGYYIVDREKKELILYRGNGGKNEVSNDKRVALSDEFLGHSHLSKKFFYEGSKLYLPLLIKGECIGFIMVDGKANGIGKDAFHQGDLFFLRLITEKASTQIENHMLYESLFENALQTLTSLITAINKRDLYTEGHCKRVTEASLKLGRVIGVTDYEEDVLKVVGPIHDLGKVGVPDSILLKPKKLTYDEYQIMKDHSACGEEIVNRFEILSSEAKIIRYHHERFDGIGYPDTLHGDEIPKCARIIAVCDAYDAMTSDRPYRKALSKDVALAEIKKCKGMQFDPEISDAFCTMLGEREMRGGVN